MGISTTNLRTFRLSAVFSSKPYFGLNIKYEGGTNFVFGEKATVVYQSLTEGVSVTKGTVITVKILFEDEEE